MSYNIIATPNFKKEFKHLAKKYSSLKDELGELISSIYHNNAKISSNILLKKMINKINIKQMLILVLLMVSKYGMAQSPGNLGTSNISLWFKPDSLPLGDVINWNSSYPNGVNTVTFRDSSGAPYPKATDTSSGVLNYNKVISFIGNSATNVLSLGKLGTVNYLNNNVTANTGSFIMVYYLPSYTATGGHMMHYRESGGDGIQFRHLGASVRCAIGTTNSTNGSRDYNEDYKPMIFSYTGNKSGANTMTAYKRGLTFTTSVSSATTGDNGILIGSRIASSAYAGFFEGYVGEVIFYNNTLSFAEINKVHSYLAIKYGITLDNTGGGIQGNYTSPSGKILWNAAVNNSYHNNIIGVAREDNEFLYQKQSHSIDDSTRLYVDYLSTNNSGNFTSIFVDSSYLILGSNLGKLSSTATANLEKPSSGVVSRIEREFKVTNTNFYNNFYVDIKLDSIAVLTNVNTSHLCLLVDNDSNFTNATIYTSSSGLFFSYASGVVTISNISTSQIPLDSTMYFTLGSTNINTPLPVAFGNFTAIINNENIDLNWSTFSEKNNQYFTAQRSFDGKEWIDLTNIKAANNSSTKLNYFYSDLNVPIQNLFYRIKQTDLNGNYTFSKIANVNLNTKKELEIKVYPSIAQQYIDVTIKLNDFKIVDYLGRDFTKHVKETTNNLVNSQLDISSLPSGTFFLIVENKNAKFFKN